MRDLEELSPERHISEPSEGKEPVIPPELIQIRSVDPRSIASMLGGAYDVHRSSMGPCPFCAKKVRHRKSSDKILAVEVYETGEGYHWHCYHCEMPSQRKYGTLDFVSAHSHRLAYSDLPPEKKLEVRAVVRTILSIPEAKRPKHEQVEPPPSYPEGVQEFWDDCLPVSRDVASLEYLAAQKFPIADIRRTDVVRYCPTTIVAPKWAAFEHGSTFRAAGYHLVFPQYDVNGALKTVTWRRLDKHDTLPKHLGSRKVSRTRVLYACPLALQILRGEITSPMDVVITEGDKDTLMSACLARGRWATLGLLVGGWTAEFGEKLNALGCRVSIATDTDLESGTGDRFAEKVQATLAQPAYRWRPSAGKDVCEHVQAGHPFEPFGVVHD